MLVGVATSEGSGGGGVRVFNLPCDGQATELLILP